MYNYMYVRNMWKLKNYFLSILIYMYMKNQMFTTILPGIMAHEYISVCIEA